MCATAAAGEEEDSHHEMDVSTSEDAFLRASYASSGNLLSITIGHGGFGNLNKQSALLPLDSVACKSKPSLGKAFETMSVS